MFLFLFYVDPQFKASVLTFFWKEKIKLWDEWGLHFEILKSVLKASASWGFGTRSDHIWMKNLYTKPSSGCKKDLNKLQIETINSTGRWYWETLWRRPLLAKRNNTALRHQLLILITKLNIWPTDASVYLSLMSLWLKYNIFLIVMKYQCLPTSRILLKRLYFLSFNSISLTLIHLWIDFMSSEEFNDDYTVKNSFDLGCFS